MHKEPPFVSPLLVYIVQQVIYWVAACALPLLNAISLKGVVGKGTDHDNK